MKILCLHDSLYHHPNVSHLHIHPGRICAGLSLKFDELLQVGRCIGRHGRCANKSIHPHHYSRIYDNIFPASFHHLSFKSGSTWFYDCWFDLVFACLHQHNLGFIVGFAMTFIKLSGWPCWPSSLCQTPAGMRLGDGHSINSMLICSS